ncbi:hypothetical protein [Pseudovibrio sp. Tun.PSC04-5.I4]|uniref:hypothetical protein n=1 Tax=Pseudovibrio sp. Tun.PSC04-5.I4 TaxID=1798213 RepID=UPI00088CAE64|nr:hypothetical protein [Pseudovibrio sp. Tun.PSC04-5.I4]SDR10403.1 hypothetical protein SAMN04515695_2782 [Pseudovibrio sp. Tun.PSC04-5.I4]
MSDGIDVPGVSLVEIGQRLEGIRLEQDLDAPVFAAQLGVSEPDYLQWESGMARIPLAAALEVKKRTGQPLDYIYLGRDPSKVQSFEELSLLKKIYLFLVVKKIKLQFWWAKKRNKSN